MCPYNKNILCDYSSTAGDVVCTYCPHFPNKKEIRQTEPKITWFNKLKSILNKWA